MIVTGDLFSGTSDGIHHAGVLEVHWSNCCSCSNRFHPSCCQYSPCLKETRLTRRKLDGGVEWSWILVAQISTICSAQFLRGLYRNVQACTCLYNPISHAI